MSTANGTTIRTRYATDGTGQPTSPPYEVLVAEDDTDMRETLCLWLANRTEWEPRPANDGREVLAALDSSVDALLLDRRMPELSGPEIVDRLPESGFDGPVVVVSAYEPDESLDEDDVAAYLVKPVEHERVIEVLEGVVGRADD